MPEGGVVILDEREIGWEEDHVPRKINRDDDEAFTGTSQWIAPEALTDEPVATQESSSLILNVVLR